MTAGQIFLESPMESPNIPTWNRIDTALPSFLSDLKKAVINDNFGFEMLKRLSEK